MSAFDIEYCKSLELIVVQHINCVLLNAQKFTYTSNANLNYSRYLLGIHLFSVV